MKSEFVILTEYPKEIRNQEGLIVAARISECPFPEGTGVEFHPDCLPLTVDLMAQKWNCVCEEGCGHNDKWAWFYPDRVLKDQIDEMLEQEELETNRWYFIDWWNVAEEEGEEYDAPHPQEKEEDATAA